MGGFNLDTCQVSVGNDSVTRRCDSRQIVMGRMNLNINGRSQSRSEMRRPLLVAVLILVGCTGDAEKLRRLEVAEARAFAQFEMWQTAASTTPGAPGVQDSLAAARTRHTLAQRELEAFKAGR